MFDTSPSHGLSILRRVLVALRPLFAVLQPVAVVLRRVLGVLWRIFQVLANFIEYFLVSFGVALLVGMWGLLFFNTIYRWAGASATGWGLEIIGFMVAWSIFVMAGPVTRHDAHIRVNFFPEKLLGAEKGATFMHILENLVGLGTGIFLTLHAYRFVANTFDMGYPQTMANGWEFPMWILHCGILVGFLFLTFYYFERTLKWIISLCTRKGATGGEMSPEGPAGNAMEEFRVTQERGLQT